MGRECQQKQNPLLISQYGLIKTSFSYGEL